MENETIILFVGIVIIIVVIAAFSIQPSEDLPHYAEGFYQSYDTPIYINTTVTDVYYNVTGFTLDKYYGFVIDNNAVMTTHKGLYKISAAMSFSGGNGAEYEAELFINGVGKEECVFFRSTSSTLIGDAGFSCIMQLEENDHLIMKVKDFSSPPKPISIYRLNFNIVEIKT